MKLYPVKSNNLVTTSINTQFHVAKELVDYTLGFTISMDLYYNPATHNETRYNGVSGRGNNTGFHSGMFMPGVATGTNFAGGWRNAGSFSLISKTGLTADWYRFSMIVTPTTVVIKLLNLRTNVELTGNTVDVGTTTNGDTSAYTFLSYGIEGYTGAYGSIGVNISNIKITRGSSTLFHAPLSEGYLAIVRDVVSKTAYALGFFTISAGWAKLADFYHYNFKNGYTLYTKLANPNIYVPNDSTGAEIPWTPLLSYVKVANYGPCLNEFNQCESKFKLDDVAEVSRDVLAVCPDTFYSGLYVRQNDGLYICAANNCEISIASGTWRFRNRTTYAIPYLITQTKTNPGIENWSVVGVTCSNPVVFSNIDLYNADVDHVLFTEGTGVAKEIEIGSMYSEIVDLTHDRGHLYINEDSDKKMLLYKTDKGVDTPADLKVWKYVNKE